MDRLSRFVRRPGQVLRRLAHRLVADARPPERSPHQDYRYRAPQDLRLAPAAPLRVLALGSCLVENLAVTLRQLGHEVETVTFNYVCELPPKSAEALAGYDFQIVQIPMRNLMVDHVYFNLAFDDLAGHQAHYERARATLEQMVEAALDYHRQQGVLTIFTNFLVPQQNPLGRLLPRYDIRNPVHFVEQLNRHLDELLAPLPGVFVLDVDQISATHGRMHQQEDHVWSVSHGSVMLDFDHALDQGRIHPATPMFELYPLRPSGFLMAVCNEAEALYRTARQIDQVKLVAVDLDDTLWRGVVAEEGGFGDMEGWPLGLAEALAFLKARGVLLAILSKNDQGRIEGLWDSYFQGRLHLDAFAVRKINWRPKAENMAEVLAETNLLPSSVVFVDDNPVERAAMQAAFPEMRVLGAEPYLLRRLLLWAPETQVAAITAESGRRTEMIQAQAERGEARERLSREDFLASLELKVRPAVIAGPRHPRFARAFELLNKTNQFNTTGRRWTHAEMTSLFAGGGRLHAFEVEDRYSRYGLTGVAVVAGGMIEQLVMSCRVVGLDVELTMLAEVCRSLRDAGHGRIEALARETEANLLSRDLFARGGFDPAGDGWSLPSGREVSVSAHAALLSPERA